MILQTLLKKSMITDIKYTTFGKRIYFTNGYSVSIIQGCGRNCKSTYEVAVIAPWGIDYTYTNGDTLNYQSESDVIQTAKFVARLDMRLGQKAHDLKISQQKYFSLMYNKNYE